MWQNITCHFVSNLLPVLVLDAIHEKKIYYASLLPNRETLLISIAFQVAVLPPLLY